MRETATSVLFVLISLLILSAERTQFKSMKTIKNLPQPKF